VQWQDLTVTAVSSSAGLVSGSFSGDFWGPYLRMQSLWTSGTGASFTGSFSTKS
jgi:hypothetical protein